MSEMSVQAASLRKPNLPPSRSALRSALVNGSPLSEGAWGGLIAPPAAQLVKNGSAPWQPQPTTFQTLGGTEPSPSGGPGGARTGPKNSVPPLPASGAPPKRVCRVTPEEDRKPALSENARTKALALSTTAVTSTAAVSPTTAPFSRLLIIEA